MNKIDKSLTKTIKTSDLQNVSTDLAEVILDSMLDDGILKDIPILGSIVGMGKTASTINKRCSFSKKNNLFFDRVKRYSNRTERKND
ncbi:hypothetical protein [Galbibacter sp. PAP.153]|uniref:hypothetical protein n=1 Tax=Galbibacter sp. PAP.153 TaxID=3104623 RepID=UPI00300AC187